MGAARLIGLPTGKGVLGHGPAICVTRATGTVRSPNQAQALHRALQARAHRRRLPAGPPAVSPPGSNTHTCLRPRTLAASGGEKGNALCFKDVFVSVGGETPKFEESMAKTFLLRL